MARRSFLLAAPAGLIAACSGASNATKAFADTVDDAFPDSEWRDLTEAEWKERLDPLAFRVLRQEATERAFTSPLNDEKREGVFHCAGCDLAIIRFGDKYKQWNAAFDAGYCAALGKPYITLHDADIVHPLKEVDADAAAWAQTPAQVVDILRYVTAR